MLIIEIEKRHNKMVDRIRYPTVSYLPFYYVFFQFLLLTIFNLQANILTTKDILSNLGSALSSLTMAQCCEGSGRGRWCQFDPPPKVRGRSACLGGVESLSIFAMQKNNNSLVWNFFYILLLCNGNINF